MGHSAAGREGPHSHKTATDGPVRVLLVDDDEDDFLLTRDLLEGTRTRFSLDRVATYEEGLDLIGRREHDAYLLDYRLGQRSGLDLLREARAGGCTQPMIIMTGQGDHEVDIEAMESGAADYLVKDTVDSDQLERSLRYSLEQAQTQRRLEDLMQSKDEFVASVSHELRTPLTAVMGFAEVLMEQWTDQGSSEAKEMIEVIARQTREAANIVDDLLVAARSQIGKLVIKSESLDLQAEAARVVAGMQPSVNDTVLVSGQAVGAQADPVRFRQILRNLLANAFRYGGKRIGIDFSGGPAGTVVEVWDDGLGVPEADRDSIFEPYTSAHDSPHQPGAMGLGLAVSLTLARLMGGDLTYHYSEGRSVFRLTLPGRPDHLEKPSGGTE